MTSDTRSGPNEKHGWSYFGPRAGIHSWLVADLVALFLAALLAILYVWVDKPGPSDVGAHTLSGWLVGVFGPDRALPAGMALFGVVSALLLLGLIAYLRWLSAPGRERRRHRKSLE